MNHDLLSALQGYYLFHATRADLLRRLGRRAEPAEACHEVAAIAPTDAERDYLTGRADGCA